MYQGAFRQIWFCFQICFIRWIRVPKQPRDVALHNWCVGLAVVSGLHIIFSCSLYRVPYWPEELRTRVQSQLCLADLTVDVILLDMNFKLLVSPRVQSTIYLATENVQGKSYKWITKVNRINDIFWLLLKSHQQFMSPQVQRLENPLFNFRKCFKAPNSCAMCVLFIVM